MAAETAESSWGVVADVRAEGDARSEVSTVDQADTIAGRIAVVLGLAREIDGITGHYGADEDASDGVIPEPSPAA